MHRPQLRDGWAPEVIAMALATALVLGGLATAETGFAPFESQSAVTSALAAWILGAIGIQTWLHAPERSTGPLMIVASFAWLLAPFGSASSAPSALVGGFAGPLSVALLTHALLVSDVEGAPVPPLTRRVLIGTAYGAAFLAWVMATPALVAVAPAVTGIAMLASATRRLDRDQAFGAASAIAFAIAISGAPILRVLTSRGFGLDMRPAIAITAILVAALTAHIVQGAHDRRARLVDLVVKLEDEPPGDLISEVRAGLRDRSATLAYWVPELGSFVDASGFRIAEPSPGSDRRSTVIARDGQVVALLIHRADADPGPSLRDAILRAAALSAAQARLQADLAVQTEAVASARRRLVEAEDHERRLLVTEISRTVEPELDRLQRSIDALDLEHFAASTLPIRLELTAVRRDVTDILDGLFPRPLVELGLSGALVALASQAPVTTSLAVSGDLPHDPTIEATIWFVANEAMANVAKHARATSCALTIRIGADRIVVEVADDGRGGADPSSGRGLQGIRDRVDALGGWMTVIDVAGGGTRLAAVLPLAGPIRDRDASRS